MTAILKLSVLYGVYQQLRLAKNALNVTSIVLRLKVKYSIQAAALVESVT